MFRAIGPDTLVWYLPSLGLAQALQGSADDARACVAEAEALLARVSGTTMAAGDVLAYLVWTDLVLSDRDRLGHHLDRLAPFRGQFHDMLIDRLLGEVALVLGDRAAGRHLRIAEAAARQEWLPLELGRVLAATASLEQVGVGRADDRSTRELLEEACGLYEHLGNRHEAARIRERIAALLSPERRREVPAGLTAREVEVLRLVVRGLSNRQIAEALTVTEKTVENHLTSAYGKIGAENRAAAAAFTVRHGLA